MLTKTSSLTKTGFGLGILVAVAALTLACAPGEKTPLATGGDAPPEALTGNYLGQDLPSSEPRLFAPGTVSTGLFNRDIAITPDGDEIYFGTSVGARFDFSTILVSRRVDGVWSEPVVAPFAASSRYMDIEPFITADGSKLYFASNRPREQGSPDPVDHDIWVMDRTESGWSEPYNLGAPVNTEAEEFFPSLTRDGTIYFTREDPQTRSGAILRARGASDGFEEPQALPDQVNGQGPCFNAWIAPDESYLILPIFGREDSLGATDYYVVFRDSDDTWSDPVHLGDKVNSKSSLEYSASVSPDGRFLFFMSGRTPVAEELGESFTRESIHDLHQRSGNGNADIYWVDAAMIEELRATAEYGG